MERPPGTRNGGLRFWRWHMTLSRSCSLRRQSAILMLGAMLLYGSGATAAVPAAYKIDECAGSGADANHVAIEGHGPADQIMSELIRIKHPKVTGVERISNTGVEFHFGCAPVALIVRELADVSSTEAKQDANGGFRIVVVKNGAELKKLRAEAEKYTAAKNNEKLKLTLQRIVALSQPGEKGEAQSDVENEYHQLGNMAMEDKDYVHAEQFFRGRLAEIEREGETEGEDYAFALSNVADAREYQDDFTGAKKLYERALALMEKHPGPVTLPNSVLILETLANNALQEKRFGEADAYAERAWAHLNDAQRIQWISPEHALEIASDAEEEFGRLGAKAAAEMHYERALKLKEDRYGADSAETVAIRHHVIFAALLQGKAERAAQYSEQQLVAAEKRGDRTSDNYVSTLYQLLAIYANQEKLDRVITHWQDMLDARRALLGDNSPHVAAALHDLATLYRLDRQWTQAATAEQRAAAIKADDDASALNKLERSTKHAMEYDPALWLLCIQIETRWHSLTDFLITPVPPIPPDIFFDLPDPTKPGKPAPADQLEQARLFEQAAECAGDSPTFSIHELERALRIRIAAQGEKNPDTRATARRLIEFSEKAGDTKSADRFRALIRD